MTEQQVFATAVATVGYVRCAADHPSFATPGRVSGTGSFFRDAASGFIRRDRVVTFRIPALSSSTTTAMNSRER